MADAALFLGWNRPVTGREGVAAEMFDESMAYYSELQQSGRIESFEPVLLSSHGGDLNGFILLRGESAKLDELRNDNEFVKRVVRAGHCLENLGVIPAYVGSSIIEMMSLWRDTIGK